jgi:proteasome lid subunit RPN8/RPN11
MDSVKMVEDMRAQSIAAYPQEACGLVVGLAGKPRALPCKNVSAHPEQQFELDPEDYARISDTETILGVWHSHVNISPVATEADRVGCENSELPWYIISIKKLETGEYDFDGPTVIEPCGFEMSYLERPYVWGVLDCYSLVRDWYKREYGIVIRDYPRKEQYWATGEDLLGDNWESEGFIKLVDEQPVKGDVFLLSSESKIMNSIMIYMGDGTALHHPHGRLSRIEVYGGYWLKHTVLHLRHKERM